MTGWRRCSPAGVEDSLVSEALRRARPHVAAAVEATEELLRRHGVAVAAAP
jgi:hypothetical protein